MLFICKNVTATSLNITVHCMLMGISRCKLCRLHCSSKRLRFLCEKQQRKTGRHACILRIQSNRNRKQIAGAIFCFSFRKVYQKGLRGICLRPEVCIKTGLPQNTTDKRFLLSYFPNSYPLGVQGWSLVWRTKTKLNRRNLMLFFFLLSMVCSSSPT